LRRRFIERAADAVTRADNHLKRQPCLFTALFKLADYIDQRLAQARRVIVGGCLTNLHHRVQQWRRSLK
jgi:hypothetical protein